MLVFIITLRVNKNSMRRDRWFLFVAIALVIGFIIFNSFSGLWSRKIFSKFGDGETPTTERERLRSENDKLKAEISALQQFKKFLPAEPKGLPVFVYSRYPFNIKNEVLVNAGSNQGIKPGQVALHKGFYVGKVKTVYSDSALIETIFDSRIETAVRVGDEATDALLKGGDEPKLTLIPKNSEISNGEVIYSAAQDIPYGMPIGQVREYRLRDGAPFGEAIIRFSYSPSEMNVLEIIK